MHAIPDAEGRLGVLFHQPQTLEWVNFGGGSTDSLGRYSQPVRFGGPAGPVKVLVEVPALGLVDTAHYTVLPGKAALVAALPSDTAIQVGRSFALRAQVTDRYGNPRTEQVTYHASDPGVQLALSTVIGTAYSRSRIVASYGPLHDTTFVSVVPSGTIVATGSQGTYLFDTDLTGFRRISNHGGDYAKWNPLRAEVITDGAGYSGPMYAIALDGSIRPLVQPPLNLVAEYAPQFSADGAWIYFTGGTPGTASDSYQLWRVRSDGTGASRLQGVPDTTAVHPAPAPDGRTLVYVTLEGTGELRSFDLLLGAPLGLHIPGHSPRWSPDGSRLAYLEVVPGSAGGHLKTIRSDGTDIRGEGDPQIRYSLGIAWSPDGRWLIARNASGGRITLVDVQTGLTLPLPRTDYDLESPDWKP